MGVQGWKKIIAIFIVIAFIGVGVAWALEQDSPQFQEKTGTPVIKKHRFPWLIAILGAAAVGACVYLLTKKKNEEQPQDVTLNIDVYNHTQEQIKDDYKLTVKAGSSVTITFNQLAVTGVVKDYLILRNAHSGVDLGSYVTSSDTSSVTFTAPNSNTNYDLFLLNDGPAASLYRDLWDGRHDKRIWDCYRLDWNQEGPQEPWNDAFARLRSGLTKNGIEYGKIILVPGTTGDLRYGYYDYGGFGWHDIVGKWISVNTDKCPSYSLKYWVALAEGLEFFTHSNNRVNVVTEDNKIDDLMCMKFLLVNK